jgi:pimeloyl-ACP methyl ester carboxylesterase
MNIVLTISGVLAVFIAFLVLFTVYTARKVESVLPAKGRFIDVPGARLHIREFGEAHAEGPAILMIHGLAGQLSHYTYGVAGKLSAHHRVIVVDRPGSGYSTRAPETSADLSAQAASMAALIRTLGLGPAFVVGHSLGGAVALTLALEHPELVAGLGLLAPLTHIREDVPPVFKGLTIQSPLMRKLVAWTMAIPVSIKNSTTTLEVVFGPESVPKDFATKGGGLLSLRPSAFLSASADLQALPGALAAGAGALSGTAGAGERAVREGRPHSRLEDEWPGTGRQGAGRAPGADRGRAYAAGDAGGGDGGVYRGGCARSFDWPDEGRRGWLSAHHRRSRAGGNPY